jgi:hypothetical protein
MSRRPSQRANGECKPAFTRISPGFKVCAVERDESKLGGDKKARSDSEKNADTDKQPFVHSTPRRKTLGGVD